MYILNLSFSCCIMKECQNVIIERQICLFSRRPDKSFGLSVRVIKDQSQAQNLYIQYVVTNMCLVLLYAYLNDCFCLFILHSFHNFQNLSNITLCSKMCNFASNSKKHLITETWRCSLSK